MSVLHLSPLLQKANKQESKKILQWWPVKLYLLEFWDGMDWGWVMDGIFFVSELFQELMYIYILWQAITKANPF